MNLLVRFYDTMCWRLNSFWRTWGQFWREMDECAERYDRLVEAGFEQELSFLKDFRRGQLSLWKSFWIYTVAALIFWGVLAYVLFLAWAPLANAALFCFAANGLISCEALRFSASRYNGAKIWRRSAQLVAVFLMVSCGLLAIGFSASAAGY